MGLEIITGDIFECSADALVFPASNYPKIYGTLDEQIYKKAGETKLLKARKNIGNMGILKNGEAGITDSFGLKEQYKYLIHVPIPGFQFSIGREMPLPRYNRYYSLGTCYTNALELIKKNKLTSVVFPILGTGASGYPYKMAKDFAIGRIKCYIRRNPEINIILVEYRNQEQYRNVIQIIKKAKELNGYSFPDWHINENSIIGEHINCFSNLFKQKIKSEVDSIYLQYKKEEQEFCEEMQLKKSEGLEVPKDIHQEFNDLLYKKIFDENIKTTHEEFAFRANINSNKITGIRNLKKQNGEIYTGAISFLRYKENVITIAKALNLSLNDLCRFIWSRNHYFPTTDADYKLISEIKQKELERKDSHKE
ncbi:MAG: macro domain-containing protein [Ruminococcus sp.]|nr:macro domain-containing protein [Ruminococcus sp.]